MELLLSSFLCAKNKDVEDFLHKKAVRFEQSDKARTTLIIDENTANIVAYYTLSQKEIKLENSDLSKTEKRKLDGISKESNSVIGYLIGQLAKNDAAENNNIKLKNILDYVYSDIDMVRKRVGGRVVIVECENKESLINLYKKHEFKFLKSTPDESGLVSLYTVIKE